MTRRIWGPAAPCAAQNCFRCASPCSPQYGELWRGVCKPTLTATPRVTTPFGRRLQRCRHSQRLSERPVAHVDNSSDGMSTSTREMRARCTNAIIAPRLRAKRSKQTRQANARAMSVGGRQPYYGGDEAIGGHLLQRGPKPRSGVRLSLSCRGLPARLIVVGARGASRFCNGVKRAELVQRLGHFRDLAA